MKKVILTGVGKSLRHKLVNCYDFPGFDRQRMDTAEESMKADILYFLAVSKVLERMNDCIHLAANPDRTKSLH